MKFWLEIKDSSFLNTKDVELRLWDSIEEEGKHLRQQVVDDIVPQEVVKRKLKENIIRLFSEELEKYIDGVFKNKAK